MMTEEEQVLAYLEHYGVKGMQWGRRKARRLNSNAMRSVQQRQSEIDAGKKALDKPAKERTPQERRAARGRKAELGFDIVSGVVAVGLGAAMVGSILSKHGSRSAKSLTPLTIPPFHLRGK